MWSHCSFQPSQTQAEANEDGSPTPACGSSKGHQRGAGGHPARSWQLPREACTGLCSAHHAGSTAQLPDVPTARQHTIIDATPGPRAGLGAGGYSCAARIAMLLPWTCPTTCVFICRDQFPLHTFLPFASLILCMTMQSSIAIKPSQHLASALMQSTTPASWHR